MKDKQTECLEYCLKQIDSLRRIITSVLEHPENCHFPNINIKDNTVHFHQKEVQKYPLVEKTNAHARGVLSSLPNEINIYKATIKSNVGDVIEKVKRLDELLKEVKALQDEISNHEIHYSVEQDKSSPLFSLPQKKPKQPFPNC